MRHGRGHRTWEAVPPAVSSVVGTVLMLGITLAVFAGFSLVVLQQTDADEVPARTELGILQQGDRVLLQHRGGDGLRLVDGRVLMAVDGTATDLPLAALAAQTTDGTTWRIGEALCLSGPQPPCQYDGADVEDVRVVYGNTLLFSSTAAADGTDPIFSYVSAITATTGSVTSPEAAQVANDAGAEATLSEGAVALPAGSGTATLSGATATGNSATDPNNALAGALSGDAGNARALLDGTGDWVEVSGFALPAGASGITGITLGFEGRTESSSGNLPTVQLSYRVSGVLGPATLSQGLTSTTDAQFPLSVTGDRAWTPSDVAALAVRVTVTNNPNRVAGIDHLYVTVQYTTAAQTVQRLDAELGFTAVPGGDQHVLDLDYRATGDTFQVQVWDGSSFTARGTLGAGTSARWSYTLTEDEYNAGAPRVRLVDLTAGPTVGSLALDFARVVTT